MSVDEILEEAMRRLDKNMGKFDDDMLKFDREYSRASKKYFDKRDPRYETEKTIRSIKKQTNIMKIVNYGLIIILILICFKLGYSFYGYITNKTFDPKPLAPITEQVKDDLKKL